MSYLLSMKEMVPLNEISAYLFIELTVFQQMIWQIRHFK